MELASQNDAVKEAFEVERIDWKPTFMTDYLCDLWTVTSSSLNLSYCTRNIIFYICYKAIRRIIDGIINHSS